MKQVDLVFKACADKNRIRILKLLEKRKLCVCELAYIIGISQPSVSKHLKKLKGAGLIAQEKDGLWTNYYIEGTNQYAKRMLSELRTWLHDDPVIASDDKKAREAKREMLCSKA